MPWPRSCGARWKENDHEQAPTTLVTLAEDLIPGAKPTKIPGLAPAAPEIFGYGLWLLILAGVGGAGFGVYKLAVADKSRNGGGSQPFKWMGGGIATSPGLVPDHHPQRHRGLGRLTCHARGGPGTPRARGPRA
ncbi:hypothetical protein SBADM41S_03788 [Streptomyces badius]